MNKPIRRVAFVAMLMFALLLANGTYMMVFRQESLAAEPQNRRVRDAEFAQDRGSILAAGKTEIATTKPVKDRFKFQRTYPEGSLYTPITGFYSYDHARSALESTYNTQLAGTDDSLFVRRIIDMATNRTPEGASVQTTIVPKVQKAAAKAIGNQKGAVVALDPQTGAVLALVTSASTAPVCGSRATTAPFWLPRALAAAICTLGTMVVWTLAPSGVRLVARSMIRRTKRESSVPASWVL